MLHLITVTDTHIHTHIPSVGLLGREIGPSQTPLSDNIQRSQETDIHGPGEVRPRNPCKRVAARPRLKRAATGIAYRKAVRLIASF